MSSYLSSFVNVSLFIDLVSFKTILYCEIVISGVSRGLPHARALLGVQKEVTVYGEMLNFLPISHQKTFGGILVLRASGGPHVFMRLACVGSIFLHRDRNYWFCNMENELAGKE